MPNVRYRQNQEPEEPIRVVLVEDDTILRQGLADYLKLSGLVVMAVGSGLELYRTLRGQPFDVAILDVNLPDTNGFELARDLRAESALGIIMLTARTSQEDRLRSYEEGADIFLTKPTDGAELALAATNLGKRIRATRAVSPPAPENTSSTWLLQQRMLVTPERVAIALTQRESLFLEMVAAANGTVIPRESLEAELGYSRTENSGRGLDAMLQRLRTKARQLGVELPIQIVHSIGMRWLGTLRKD